MLSVMPCPMGSNEVIEGHMFTGPFDDGMGGSIVVTKLYVGVGEKWSY